MQTTDQANPELQLQAEKYVGTGYQRLLTFEVNGGGFSLFGGPPARVFLSAYGLMEFNDMAKVYPVDEAVIERAARWLLDQQQPDGTWQVNDYRAGQGTLGATSYVVWALVEAGHEDTPQVGQAVSYIREFALQEVDAYNLALAERLDLDVLTLCGSCTNTLRRGRQALVDPGLRDSVNDRLGPLGLRVSGSVQVKHLVQVLWERRDLLREREEVLLEGISEAKHAVVPNAGHLPQMDNPQGFLQQVTQFLSARGS